MPRPGLELGFFWILRNHTSGFGHWHTAVAYLARMKQKKKSHGGSALGKVIKGSNKSVLQGSVRVAKSVAKEPSKKSQEGSKPGKPSKRLEAEYLALAARNSAAKDKSRAKSRPAQLVFAAPTFVFPGPPPPAPKARSKIDQMLDEISQGPASTPMANAPLVERGNAPSNSFSALAEVEEAPILFKPASFQLGVPTGSPNTINPHQAFHAAFGVAPRAP